MSSSFEIENLKISLEKLFKILQKNNLTNSKKISQTKKMFNIFINSKDINKYYTKNIKKDSFIYFSRHGEKFDGHQLAEDIIASKNYFVGNHERLIFIAEKNKYSSDWVSKIISNKYFINVKDVEKSIYAIFENYYLSKSKKLCIIAVTGTNGKTSVVQLISQLIHEISNEDSIRIGTFGIQYKNHILESSHVTTPDYPMMLQILNLAHKINTNKIIMEATSHGLNENRLGNIKVDVSIFTNLTQDHLDYHKNMNNYLKAKLLLFKNKLKNDGTAIVCTNNDYWENFAESAIGKKRILVGIGSKNTLKVFFEKFSKKFKEIKFITVNNSVSSFSGICGLIELYGKNGLIAQSSFKSSLIGSFQFDNLLCALATQLIRGFSLSEITKKISNIKNVSGRLEVVKLSNQSLTNQPTVIVDYAHTPDALEKVLKTCRDILKNTSKGKLITVFGCGGDRDATKRPIMGKIASELSDLVIITSDNPRTEDPVKIIADICFGIQNLKNCFKYVDRKSAIKYAIQIATANDFVIIAGKGHENYQIIGENKISFSDSKIALSILQEETNSG
jgi:UDP-N-acetylmuramyl-tripeptide synthetase